MGTAVRRMLVVTCVAFASVAASASPASAAVTIGQTGPVTGLCSPNQDWAQQTVSSGNPYVVPSLPPAAALSIISWSHLAYSSTGAKLKLKVYRPLMGLTYRVVAQETRDLTPNVLNTFPTSIAVQPGDILGITNGPGTPATGCGTGAFSETDLVSNGTDTPTGEQVTFSTVGGARLNVSAVVEPTNTFTIGATTRNKKRGTATLALDVPNPGELTVSGNGVKEASSAVSAAGAVQLTIRATGKKRRKLNRTGKAQLYPSITYTPTGGSASAQSTTLKLKKKL